MVILLIDQEAQRQRRDRVESAQQMELQRRNRPVDNHKPKILDVAENRIQKEQPLRHGAITVNPVKNSRQIRQQRQEYIIKVLRIPEEDEHGRQDHTDSQIEYQQAQHRIGQRKHVETEGDAVEHAEEEIHHQDDHEVDKRRHISGEDEQILWDIDFAEDPGIAHQAVHATPGGLLKISHHQVAAEQIGGVEGGVAPKELGEYQLHNQKRQQRGQHTPGHTQNRALIFFFEVSLDQFLEEELVFF